MVDRIRNIAMQRLMSKVKITKLAYFVPGKCIETPYTDYSIPLHFLDFHKLFTILSDKA